MSTTPPARSVLERTTPPPRPVLAPTRRGRFRRIDPRRTRRLPGRWRWAGFLGWLGFVAAVLAVAWRRSGVGERSVDPSGSGGPLG